jgi:uncharacterized membrane protein
MSEAHSIAADIARLTELERRIIHRFIHRHRVAHAVPERPVTFGDQLADRVATFGGSWPFIFIALGAIVAWMAVNAATRKPFDPFPYILLNLVLSCLAALQAPVIMMSQNRQAAHDRLDAQHDYEVNTKAEMEIMALHTKLDELREQKWLELMSVQEQQLALLARLISSGGFETEKSDQTEKN